ncbi:MAG: hypothetical protein AAGK23_11590 [Pseudomonadota bacterium]
MYDARGPSNEEKMGHLGFAIIVLAIVVGAFLLVLKGPNLFGSSQEVAQRTSDGLLGALPGVDMARLDQALLAFDPDAHMAISTAIRGEQTDPQALQTLMVSELMPALQAKGPILAKSDVRYFDEILTLTQDRLRVAAGSGSKWCTGGSYIPYIDAMEDNPEGAIQDLVADMGEKTMIAISQFTVDLATLLLEAGVDAEKNPAEYGELTPQDNAVLQGVMFSMMADPQIISLMVAQQAGADLNTAAAGLNACSLGLTGILAARTLPEDTKARAWAALMSGQTDVSSAFGAGFQSAF